MKLKRKLIKWVFPLVGTLALIPTVILSSCSLDSVRDTTHHDIGGGDTGGTGGDTGGKDQPSQPIDTKSSWAFYETKQKLDAMNAEQLAVNIPTYKANILSKMNVTTDFTNDTDYIKLNLSTTSDQPYTTATYYNPAFAGISADANKIAQTNSSYKDFMNYCGIHLSEMGKAKIESILMQTHDYLTYDNSNSKYASLMTLHYAYNRLWKLKYGDNINLNQLTKNPNIKIETLQQDIINWATNYYSTYIVPPYLPLDNELHNIQPELKFFTDLLNSDEIIGWVYGSAEWLKTDPGLSEYFDYLNWETNTIETLNSSCKDNISNMERCFTIKWTPDINAYRIYWKSGYYPLDSNGNELPGKNSTWFAE